MTLAVEYRWKYLDAGRLAFMNTRERFHATMDFERCSPPNWEFFGPWGQTLARWISEGLSADDPWRDLRRRTGMEASPAIVPVNLGLDPPFEPELIEDTDEYTRARGADGIVRKQYKGTDNMPSFESHPVVDRKDWERLRERLDPSSPGRFPKEWPELVRQWRHRDYVLGLGQYPFGFFGTPRDFMGVTGLLMGFYDDPDLIRDIMQCLSDLWFEIWLKVLSDVDIDFVQLWEDMSFKNGPLISPRMVREFMMPHYRRLFGLARDFGVMAAWVDTDGDCSALIPPMMEAGLTGMYPFEAAAGMDVVKVRCVHPRLQMIGGIDKMAIAAGKDAIDRELDSKLPFLLDEGGYIPSLDHLTPPEVSLESFIYYRRRVTEMLEERG